MKIIKHFLNYIYSKNKLRGRKFLAIRIILIVYLLGGRGAAVNRGLGSVRPVRAVFGLNRTDSVRALDNRGLGYFLGEIWAKSGRNLSEIWANFEQNLGEK